jgi:hypothetical protein
MHHSGMIYDAFSIINTDPVSGLNNSQCLVWFWDRINELKNELIQTIELEETSNNFRHTYKQARFFAEGTFRSAEWQHWWQKIVDQGLDVWKKES